MAFTDVIKKIYPFISAAASLGGPLGTMAATVVGKAVGVDNVPATTDGISGAIAIAMADPAQREALVKAENDFRLQMAELGFKDAETLEKIAADDRANARDRETKVKDITTRVLAYALIAGFVGLCWGILFRNVKADTVIAGTIIGYLAASAQQVVNYYFGSSSGSDRKTEIMANGGK